MSLKINNLYKSFQDHTIFNDFSIEIPENTISCILGPSGCGKTTLLSILSGLLRPDRGTVLLNGIEMGEITKRVGLPTPSDVGVVFQDYGLFPWRTVEKNVAFGLEMVKTPKNIIEKHCSFYTFSNKKKSK